MQGNHQIDIGHHDYICYTHTVLIYIFLLDKMHDLYKRNHMASRLRTNNDMQNQVLEYLQFGQVYSISISPYMIQEGVYKTII